MKKVLMLSFLIVATSAFIAKADDLPAVPVGDTVYTLKCFTHINSIPQAIEITSKANTISQVQNGIGPAKKSLNRGTYTFMLRLNLEDRYFEHNPLKGHLFLQLIDRQLGVGSYAEFNFSVDPSELGTKEKILGGDAILFYANKKKAAELKDCTIKAN